MAKVTIFADFELPYSVLGKLFGQSVFSQINGEEL